MVSAPLSARPGAPPQAADAVVFGEALVDLFPESSGVLLEDVERFVRHPGGAPCNLAIGLARQGIPTALVTQAVEALGGMRRFISRGDVVVVILPNGTEAVLVRNGRAEPVPGPLARRDWLTFNDGRAVAVSPDGSRTVTVNPAGEVFEVNPATLVERVARRTLLGVVEGADTVIWPTDDRVVALGQRVVGVINPGRGVVLTSRLG